LYRLTYLIMIENTIANILIVEDEPKLADILKRGLENYNFRVVQAADGREGIAFSRSESFDLAILDVKLPFVDGFQICRDIRSRNSEMPVIMLTALDSLTDKLEGFDAGADDYMAKPFEFKELLARINVFLRRSTHKNNGSDVNSILRAKDLELNSRTKLVSRQNVNISLTAKEYALLEFFMLNPNRIISKAEIAEKIWEIDFNTGTNFIEVYVNYLRNKVDKGFEEKLIFTHRGMGYILKTN